MSVLESIVRRAILESVGTEKPKREDIALAFYAMSIAPLNVVKKIVAARAPILMYIRVPLDPETGDFLEDPGTMNGLKIETQIGVPAPDPAMLETIRSKLGGFRDLKRKVQAANEKLGGRTSKIVRAISQANIDERFFPTELVFELLMGSSRSEVRSVTGDVPREIRRHVDGLMSSLDSITDIFSGNQEVDEAVTAVKEELSLLVDEIVEASEEAHGTRHNRPFNFTDIEEFEQSQYASGESPVSHVYTPPPMRKRKASLWEAISQISESNDDAGDDEDPFGIDIGQTSVYSTPASQIQPAAKSDESEEVTDQAEQVEDDRAERIALDIENYLDKITTFVDERRIDANVEPLQRSVRELLAVINVSDSEEDDL